MSKIASYSDIQNLNVNIGDNSPSQCPPKSSIISLGLSILDDNYKNTQLIPLDAIFINRRTATFDLYKSGVDLSDYGMMFKSYLSDGSYSYEYIPFNSSGRVTYDIPSEVDPSEVACWMYYDNIERSPYSFGVIQSVSGGVGRCLLDLGNPSLTYGGITYEDMTPYNHCYLTDIMDFDAGYTSVLLGDLIDRNSVTLRNGLDVNVVITTDNYDVPYQEFRLEPEDSVTLYHNPNNNYYINISSSETDSWFNLEFDSCSNNDLYGYNPYVISGVPNDAFNNNLYFSQLASAMGNPISIVY